jgi:methylated-DNA-protein-cysteine methyltransferase-like protein
VKGRNARVYAVVRRIPRGRVATYGQIARMAGLDGQARQAGYALNALPEHTMVPWHRVINSRGGISRRSVFGAEIEQRIRLECEGVRFNAAGRVSLADYGWRAARAQMRRRRRERRGDRGATRAPGAKGSNTMKCTKRVPSGPSRRRRKKAAPQGERKEAVANEGQTRSP